MTGFNLPPGVTDKMVDDAMTGGLCDFCIDGEHDKCNDIGCRCEECIERAEDEYADWQYEMWKESVFEYEQIEPDYPDDRD